MKIVYVNDAFAIWGGLERILVEKVNLLSQLPGFRIYLLTTNQGNHPFPYPLDTNVKYWDLGIGFHHQYQYRGINRLLKKRQLVSLFRKRLYAHLCNIKPDVIVCARIEMVSTILKVKGNIPFVFESHTSRYGYTYERLGVLSRLVISHNNRMVKHADIVVALTEGDAADWRKINPKACVIPNIVHLNSCGRYSDCQSKIAIFIGRFSRQKDINSLLQVWSIVHSKHPDWLLHLFCGYGEEKDNLMHKIEQLKIGVVIHDATPDIFSKYQESSILLLTSRYEPFGLVLPEAMSCGLPVVAFDCPYGPSDIITDGVDGFLVKGRDVHVFAQKVSALIESQQMRVQMGREGIHSARRYEAERILPMWVTLFRQLSEE